MPLTPQKISRKQPAITLAIDIGGSGIKGILLNQSGQPVTERIRIATPQPATPQAHRAHHLGNRQKSWPI